MGETENKSTDLEKQYGCFIENYIRNDNYSICREERQYAVFLYNILRKYSKPEDRKDRKDIKKMFDACRIPEEADIKHVFYEATFMRDFFERNRRIHWAEKAEEKLLQKSYSPKEKILNGENSFNYRLLKYVYEDKYKDKFPILQDCWNQEERNLGHSTNEDFNMFEEEKRDELQLDVRQMMNAKPDIAVVYCMSKEVEQNAVKSYLLFLECKFESNKSSDQCKIQGKIANFLYKYYLENENIEVSPLMGKESKTEAPIVWFTRKPEEGKILISDLIKLNNKIFTKEQ